MTAADAGLYPRAVAGRADLDVPDPRLAPWRNHRANLIAFGIATLLGWFTWQSSTALAPGVSTRAIVLLSLLTGLQMGGYFSIVRYATQRWPIGPGPRLRNIGRHAMTLVVAAAWIETLPPLVRRYGLLRTPGMGARKIVLANIVVYIIVAAALHSARAVAHYRRMSRARRRMRVELNDAARLRAESELRALKAELNPHFLGNALQSVIGLMPTDVDAADRVLGQLGDLLRGAVARVDTQEVTLADELRALQPFLDLERARLRGNLVVEMLVDPDTADLLVPDMVLQPLVENAVKHGLAGKGGGRIILRANKVANGSSLELSVEDDGVSLRANGDARSSAGLGLGLSNVRTRLHELYGDRGRLELFAGAPGAIARVTLPARTEDAAPLDIGPGGTEQAGDETSSSGAPRSLGTIVLNVLCSAVCIAYVVGNFAVFFYGGMTSDAASAKARGVLEPFWFDIVDSGICSLIMALLAYAAFYMARVAPWSPVEEQPRRTPGRTFVLQAIPAACAYLLIVAEKFTVIPLMGYTGFDVRAHLLLNLSKSLFACVLFYGLASGFGYMIESLRRYAWAAASRLRLRAEIDATRRQRAEAELRALKAELNPHFVGNALNGVSVLMRTDPVAASRMVEQLGDLLRNAVARGRTSEVTLREEIETLQPFLAVERARLGRDLDMRWDVDDLTLGVGVPHMILQPLVENAVKHGLARRTEAGQIEVSARRSNQYLELLVRDDGGGLCDPPAVTPRRGVGLANARARLTELYGVDAQIELTSTSAGGTVARVTIPWHELDALRAVAGGGLPPSIAPEPLAT